MQPLTKGGRKAEIRRQAEAASMKMAKKVSARIND
jgi:hypothetical protein